MEAIFPDEPGAAGKLLAAHRRRPGSPVANDNIEAVFTVIFKRAFTVSAGALVPRADGPGIFEGDVPGDFVANGDFADGLAGWSEIGGAEASVADGIASVLRDGPSGDIRRNASFGRSLRERGIGLSVKIEGPAGGNVPQALLSAGGEVAVLTPSGDTFPLDPDEGEQPAGGFGMFSAAVTATSLSVRLPTSDSDGETIAYAEVVVSAIDYESDIVAYKPEADLIVIADSEPLPISIAVNGTVRMSQEAAVPRTLTGLGWEGRFDTPRELSVDWEAATQPLPDGFENVYFNGYRRNQRQGGAVPYPQPGDVIVVAREGGDSYSFSLPPERPVIEHAWYTGSGVDDPCLWKRRRVSMNLDTLVVEPDRDHVYAVWRAVWPQDIDPDGTGRIALDGNRRASVRLEAA